jgi:HAD superfamily hydrolase (TIGR01509 family)
MIKVILFDLDGTIIDSELDAVEAILGCTKEWNVPVSREEAATVVGQKWEVAFDMLYARHEMPISQAEASRKILQRYKEILRADPAIVPGVVEAIRDFAGSFRLALVSGSHHDDVLWALRKLGVDQHFELIYGAEQYRHSKPSPDGYLQALAAMKIGKDAAIVFEDSVAGLASAAAAGIRSVAITCTNHFRHDQSNADLCIPDFTGINSAWVRKKFG